MLKPRCKETIVIVHVNPILVFVNPEKIITNNKTYQKFLPNVLHLDTFYYMSNIISNFERILNADENIVRAVNLKIRIGSKIRVMHVKEYYLKRSCIVQQYNSAFSSLDTTDPDRIETTSRLKSNRQLKYKKNSNSSAIRDSLFFAAMP